MVCPIGLHKGRCSCHRSKGGSGQLRTGHRHYTQATGRRVNRSTGFSASQRRAGAASSGCLIMFALLSLGLAAAVALVRTVRCAGRGR